MAGIISTALAGTRDLIGMARSSGGLAKDLLAAPLDRAGIIGKPVRKYVQANPMRSAAIGASLAAGVAGMSLGGIGPFGEIGDEYKRYMTSKYGDNASTDRAIAATQGAAIVGGVAGFGLAGFGLFGRGPLAWDYTKAPGAIAKLAGKFAEKAEDVAFSTYAAAASKEIPKLADIKKLIPKKVPWMSLSVSAGIAGGIGGGLAEIESYRRQPRGIEGNMQGIGSSPNGGISPELQFSTNDLMFSLHRNNKSMRSRYQ